ncbi:hypothetical protein J6590_080457 [Homalodisca vitripennis]|nr:hypothetical protein J6590_080457 [Homalodisca vitripennis]
MSSKAVKVSSSEENAYPDSTKESDNTIKRQVAKHQVYSEHFQNIERSKQLIRALIDAVSPDIPIKVREVIKVPLKISRASSSKSAQVYVYSNSDGIALPNPLVQDFIEMLLSITE